MVLGNVRFVAGFRRRLGIDAGLADRIVAAAAGLEPYPVRALEARVTGETPLERVRAHVLHLLWLGRLEVDWAAPLGSSSTVWTPR